MGTWRLAFSYLHYHKWTAAIVVCCLTLTFSIPVCVRVVVAKFHAQLMTRADTTPLVIGAKGSRFDVVFHSLYFDAPAEKITLAELQVVRENCQGLGVPVYVVGTAQTLPVVGTSLDYFGARRLRIADGEPLIRLGDCVLGADAAEELGVGAGGHLLTDPVNPFDLAGEYPLKMRVTGVLERSHSPDDSVVFVDTKTAWVIAGLGHGHANLVNADDSEVMSREGGNIVASEGVQRFTEITDENVASFHFHGEMEDFPISAVIVYPQDERDTTLLMGMYVEPEAEAQALVPADVVNELMDLILRRQQMMNAVSIVLGVVTAMFLILVSSLSIRLRKREMETLFKIGCGRFTIASIYAIELLMLLAVSALITVGIAYVSKLWASDIVRTWLA